MRSPPSLQKLLSSFSLPRQLHLESGREGPWDTRTAEAIKLHPMDDGPTRGGDGLRVCRGRERKGRGEGTSLTQSLLPGTGLSAKTPPTYPLPCRHHTGHQGPPRRPGGRADPSVSPQPGADSKRGLCSLSLSSFIQKTGEKREARPGTQSLESPSAVNDADPYCSVVVINNDTKSKQLPPAGHLPRPSALPSAPTHP